jgi:hypothetical protein
MSTKSLVYYGRSTNNDDSTVAYGYVTPKCDIGSNCTIEADAKIAVPVKPASGFNFNKLCFELRRTGNGGSVPYTCYRLTITSRWGSNDVHDNAYSLDKIVNGTETNIDSGSIAFNLSPKSKNYSFSVTGENPTTLTCDIDGTEIFSEVDDTAPILSHNTCAVGFDERNYQAVSNNVYISLTSLIVSSETIVDIYRSPQAMLQWSDDGGFTWSAERWEDIGKIGEYYTRMHWHRLGASRNRVFRMTISDPVKRVLIASHATIEGETA